MADEEDTTFQAIELDALAQLAALKVGRMLADYHTLQTAAGTETPRFCFALFVFPEGSPKAALVTNSTREFALDMCKLWIKDEES